MKNKQDDLLVSEIPSLNYDIIKNGVDDGYENKLIADGFRKVSLSVNGEEPMTKWILRSDVPLKDNYVLCCFDGDSEVFELIEDEDLPTY